MLVHACGAGGAWLNEDMQHTLRVAFLDLGIARNGLDRTPSIFLRISETWLLLGLPGELPPWRGFDQHQVWVGNG